MSDERRTPAPSDQGRQVEQIASVQNIYFNGFQLGLSNADMNALLVLDGQPILRLNMSYTTAKTLSDRLLELVNTLQRATEHNVMTTDEVETGLRRIVQERSE